MADRKKIARCFEGFFVLLAASIVLPDAFGEIGARAPALTAAVSASIEAASQSQPDISLRAPDISLRVIDGDTMQNRSSGVRYRVANIDTPETGERARCASERRRAATATSEARRLIDGAERIDILSVGRVDPYGREVAFIRVD